jgi:hypothetical protein
LLLGRDLQTSVTVQAAQSPFSLVPSQVTVSTYDPAKLTVSKEATTPGQTSVTVPMGQPFSIQAMSAAEPSDTLRLRLEAPSYVTTDAPVPIVPAQIQLEDGTREARIDLANSPYFLRLAYGPIDRTEGRIWRSFSGSLRPGTSAQLRLTSSDTSILEIPEPSVALSTHMTVPVRPLRPGKVQIRIQAPPEIGNAVELVDVTVAPHQFSSIFSEPAPRHLVSRLQIRNPRTQPVGITISSAGPTPIRLGSAASGAGAPAGTTLLLTVPANSERTLYLEPGAGGNTGSLRLTAPDYQEQVVQIFIPEPAFSIDGGDPIVTNLSTGALPLSVVLSNQLPLGSGFASSLPLRIESSNPQVARPAAAELTLAPGETRKPFTLQLTGRGNTTITVFGPAGFGGAAPIRRDVLVTVR